MVAGAPGVSAGVWDSDCLAAGVCFLCRDVGSVLGVVIGVALLRCAGLVTLFMAEGR